jgi:NADH-quinone oxidoreductase subunit L
VVGALTAFFAGCAALGQDDIKRVLAYSTISQLGYMFLGVGAAAFGAAIFHLVTHAFFKALLFLGAGAVIHATHTQSMRQMGGLRKSMPTTYYTMLVGAFALAGFPLFSGFFSKDMILYEALVRYNSANSSPIWGLVYGLGVFTGLITAVYTTRLICMTFFGEYRGAGQPHEAPSSMRVPLVVLGVLAVLGGLLGLPAVFSAGSDLLPGAYLGRVFEENIHHAAFFSNLPSSAAWASAHWPRSWACSWATCSGAGAAPRRSAGRPTARARWPPPAGRWRTPGITTRSSTRRSCSPR